MAASRAPVNSVKANSARFRRSISLPFGIVWNDVLHLLQRRRFPLPLRRGNARILFRQIEIVRVGILKARLVSRLPGQPEEKRLELLQRRRASVALLSFSPDRCPFARPDAS